MEDTAVTSAWSKRLAHRARERVLHADDIVARDNTVQVWLGVCGERGAGEQHEQHEGHAFVLMR
jgi:hypothetical protein